METLSTTHEVLTGEETRDKKQLRRRWLLIMPALTIIVLVGILPLGIILIYSFLTPGDYGGITWEFSYDAYVNLLFNRDIFDDTLTLNTAFLGIYWRTIMLAFLTTLGTLLVGFPTAYFIATRPASQREIWVLLITIPFWANLLVRIYAMLLLIRDEGLINRFLMWTGLRDEPFIMIYTDFGVAVGLIFTFLPFMVLPLYASLERLDFSLVEAAADMFASRWQILRRVIIPLSKPGIISGCMLVFIPSLGSFIIPFMLGGGKQLMIGNLVILQFGSGRNWPLGSAAAMVLMVLVMTALMVFTHLSKKGGLKY